MSTGAPVRDEPLAVELMNTIWADRAGVHDALATTATAKDWLEAHSGRLGSYPAPRLGALRELRDAARSLGALVTGDARAASPPSMARDEAIRVVNRHVRAAAAWTELQWNGALTAVPHSTAAGSALILAALAESVVAVLGGDGELRACTAPGCVLFYARVHDRREWCSAACGNRARVARHYDRHRVTAHK